MKKSTRIKLIYGAVSVLVALAVIYTVCSRKPYVWASWYGPHFQGKMTASGEIFNMYRMTAASRSLPFGTVIEVTDPATRSSVRVRINDRGPYKMDSSGNPVYPLEPHAYRDLDLSYAAAKRLGMLGKGVARVRIHVVSWPPGKQQERQT